MPTFEQIKTEYGPGIYNGADFGSKIRILMRSPTHVMFVALGVRISSRREGRYTGSICDRASKDNFAKPGVRAAIETAFGVGSVEAAVKAISTRGMGTILVDGGGDKLPLPHAEQVKIKQSEYETATATRLNLLPVDRKCRQCGTDLRPHTTNHHLDNPTGVGPHPKTVEDCQRLTNEPIFSVHGFASNSPAEWWSYVDWFTTWDGESYIDPLFCSNGCAATYGRRAAQELDSLPVGGQPEKNQNEHRSVDHYERPVIITASGLRL